MLAPLSWLKEYIQIELSPEELAEKLTEAGLAVEAINKEGGDVVFDLEVTPNRPDWLSIVGIAREIAAVTGKKITLPKSSTPKPRKKLPLKIKNDFEACPRYTGVIIDGIEIKPSPSWMQKRLKKVGLRPINNIVDITNYVMFELGNPLHAFDYHKLTPKEIVLQKSKGGEKFTSVDGISYELPKEAIVMKDKNRVIDLCGLKGGLNTGISNETKTVFLHVPIYNPILVRRTSQSLGLVSEASYIFERGANTGGTIEALERAASLILELAGGEIASEVIDLKKEKFTPWKLNLRLPRLEKVLGIKISNNQAVKILTNLGLSPKLVNNNLIQTTIPTFRGDLKIEEDLIEEVARIYDYNKFPLSMPTGEVPIGQTLYTRDYKFETMTKNFLKGAGFAEIYTYSLMGEEDLKNLGINPRELLKVTNPVSSGFEYLRPTLLPGLLKAVALNQPNFDEIKLFELGRVYLGKIPKTDEPLRLGGAVSIPVAATQASPKSKADPAAARAGHAPQLQSLFLKIKGIIEILLNELGISSYEFRKISNGPEVEGDFHLEGGKQITPRECYQVVAEIQVGDKVIGALGLLQPETLNRFHLEKPVAVFELDFETLAKLATIDRQFTPIPELPPVIEDLSVIVDHKTPVGSMIKTIEQMSNVRYQMSIVLVDIYHNPKLGPNKKSATFQITYQALKKQLSGEEIKKIREKIVETLKKEYQATLRSE